MIKFRNVIESLLAHQKFKTVKVNLTYWQRISEGSEGAVSIQANSKCSSIRIVQYICQMWLVNIETQTYHCRFYEFHKLNIVKQLKKKHLKVNYYHWNTFKKANQKKTMVSSSSLPRLKHNSWFRSAEVTLFFHCSSHSPN